MKDIISKHTIAISLVLTNMAPAALVTATPGGPAGTKGYTWSATLNVGDSTNLNGTVGSWAWEDRRLDALGGPDSGWRHQADWIAITLTEQTLLHLEFERADATADAKLFPSFTIFQYFNDTDDGAHFWKNNEDLQWTATSTLLEYVDHVDNSTQGSISQTYLLGPGDYSIGLGGNALSEPNPVNVNYLGSITAFPVPEPSITILGILSSLSLLRRRRA